MGTKGKVFIDRIGLALRELRERDMDVCEIIREREREKLRQ